MVRRAGLARHGRRDCLPARACLHRPRDEAGAYEALVGGRTLALRAAEEIQRSADAGEPTRLLSPDTVATALELAAAGDAAAQRLIDRECADVATGLAALCALIDPQFIVLSGGIGSQPGLAARAEALPTSSRSRRPSPRARSGSGRRCSARWSWPGTLRTTRQHHARNAEALTLAARARGGSRR